MANSKQSEKRARQNITRRRRGQSARSHYRTMVKKVRALGAGNNADESRTAFVAMQSVADRAASKKFIHANTVARIKRRISRLLQKQQVQQEQKVSS